MVVSKFYLKDITVHLVNTEALPDLPYNISLPVHIFTLSVKNVDNEFTLEESMTIGAKLAVQSVDIFDQRYKDRKNTLNIRNIRSSIALSFDFAEIGLYVEQVTDFHVIL